MAEQSEARPDGSARMSERWACIRVFLAAFALVWAASEVLKSELPFASNSRNALLLVAVIVLSFSISWWIPLNKPRSPLSRGLASPAGQGVLIAGVVLVSMTLSPSQNHVAALSLGPLVLPSWIALEIRNLRSGGELFRATLRE